jgi:hypothetical protein
MENKTIVTITICVILMLFFTTVCLLTILGYAANVQREFKGQNNLYISCPDYLKGCYCNVYGDNTYMIDKCFDYMKGK